MECALCQKERELCDSHIIPHFVFDWLKESSATGHMRFGPNMNLRVQDGLKPKLLCKECEGIFSVSESHFASKIFHPLHRDESLRHEPRPMVSVRFMVYEVCRVHFLANPDVFQPVRPQKLRFNSTECCDGSTRRVARIFAKSI
jgi:hypothetical protein